MSKLNRRVRASVVNHAGAIVPHPKAYQKLQRATLSCMLWEDQFYIDGKSHADLISDLVAQVSPDKVNALSLAARSVYKLRHVPLLLQRELARTGNLSAQVLADTIQRPDEMSEFLAMYWKDGKQPLSNQVKKGLATAFTKFNEYQLAKWDKNSAAVKLRDVMFLTHPKPQNAEQADLFKRVAADEMKTPDTWETQLSGGADKKETFTRLMQERKLGALAFIRNLRNMVDAGVDESLIRSYAATVNTEMVLPFRFIAAARQVPNAFHGMLEAMMFRSLQDVPRLPGKTVLVVDVSGSMFGAKVSSKSDLDRFDAAAALAMLCREICQEVEIYSFSHDAVRIPSHYRGFSLIDAISKSQQHGGTDLHTSMAKIDRYSPKYDRVIVFTDEQTVRRPQSPKGLGYIVNVASYEHGINHHNWTEINGFSEAVIKFIQLYEQL